MIVYDDAGQEIRGGYIRWQGRRGRTYAGNNATVGVAERWTGAGKRTPTSFSATGTSRTARSTRDVNQSNPSLITGAKVVVKMETNTNNDRSPTFLSQLVGRNGFTVTNTAIAYLGFEGEFSEGEFDLPIAIDSCAVSATNGCGTDFCATVASPPHPCNLKWAQGTNPVTCLEFASTPEQNACWTAYDGISPSINNPKLQEILDNGSPEDVEAGDEVYLDNGTKDETLKDIRNMFYGCKNNGTECGQHDPRGEDRYTPNPADSPGSAPEIDSVGGEAARLRVPGGCTLLRPQHLEDRGRGVLRDPRDPDARG